MPGPLNRPLRQETNIQWMNWAEAKFEELARGIRDVEESGTPGAPGQDGEDGRTVLNGTTAPGSGVGLIGDFYINKTTWQIWGPKTSGGWGSPTALIGPTGDTGATGASILSGSGAPTGGNNGDWWVDTTNARLYGPKASGAWPGTYISLIGPQGNEGEQGIQGPPGNDGLDGATILDGEGAPDNADGNDGDYWVDTVTARLYGPKTAGDWPETYISLGGGHAIQDEGDLLPQRGKLNFVGPGVTVTDDAVNDQTDVTVTGGSGAAPVVELIGDGVQTQFDIIHPFVENDPYVVVREAASPFRIPVVEIQYPASDTVRLVFEDATPGVDELKVTIAAIATGPAAFQDEIGDGIATQFTITHNLGTRDLISSVRRNIAPYDVPEFYIEYTTDNTATVYFVDAPGENEFTITLQGSGAIFRSSSLTYEKTIGDGAATDIVVTHNLNTRRFAHSVFRNSDPYDEPEYYIAATTPNTATISFDTAPSLNEFVAVLVASGGYVSGGGSGGSGSGSNAMAFFLGGV